METRKRVLVVEDDDVCRDAYRRMLEEAGWEVETTRFLVMGLRAVKRNAPAAVVLDLNLPDAKGFLTLRSFVGLSPRNLPIVVVTGEPDRGPEAVKMGASDYLEKPVSASELTKRVELAVARAEGGWVYQPVYDRIDRLMAELDPDPNKDTTVIVDRDTGDGRLPPPSKPRHAASTIIVVGLLFAGMTVALGGYLIGARPVARGEPPEPVKQVRRHVPIEFDEGLAKLKAEPSLANVVWLDTQPVREDRKGEVVAVLRSVAAGPSKSAAYQAVETLKRWERK